MKKFLLINMAISCVSFSFAQITITRSDFGSIGDKTLYAYDTLVSTTVSPGASGANQSWNFSSVINSMYYDSVLFTDATSDPKAPVGSNLRTIEGKDTQYLIINPSYAKFIQNASAPLTGAFALKILQFPTHYLTEFKDSSELGVTGKASAYGLPPVYDSIIIYAKINATIKCDGWGMLTTKTGSYNTLRMKNIVSTLFIVAGKILLTGQWTILQTSNPAPDISYNWMANGYKNAIASASMDTFGNIKKFKYLVNTIPNKVGLNTLLNNENNVLIYPNPANDEVHFYFNSTTKESVIVNLFNLEGRLVKSESFLTPINEIMIPVNELSNGLYNCQIISNGFTKSQKILIHR